MTAQNITESLVNEPATGISALTEHRARKQADTVKRLNGLSVHNNGRVRAAAVDDVTHLCCANDYGHGRATVYVVIEGELFELCPDCGVDAVQAKLRDSEIGDLIDVEVYRG